MTNYSLLTEAEISGKRVLLRAGFDVPMKDGEVVDTSRIESIVPTMKYILDKGASLIIMAHQGRPKGERVPELSQKPLAPIIGKLLGVEVKFVDECSGPRAQEASKSLKSGEVLLLENLRYDTREKKNDPEFAKELAQLADLYVNDAFPNCHRAHASVVGVTEHLPSYMGLQLQKEVENLSEVRDNALHPLTLIISGAKMETKVPVAEAFLDRGENILVGGCIANTFLLADEKDIAKSKCQTDQVSKAKEILAASKAAENATVHLPSHIVVASELSEDSDAEDVSVDQIGKDRCIFDIGAKTAASYAEIIKASKMIVWNGPVGVYEIDQFSNGTKAIARAIAEATSNGAKSYIGGGDTIDFHTRNSEYSLDAYTFASTGGGAMLEFISGGELPALEVLRK
ncbi:MAG: phosphoglycerate kinase [Kiritimatiellales bacterium]|nr:phosphoglycerate kinase [Kiritimatiellales bacterium]